MTQLPHLINEILDYYRYLVPWRAKMKNIVNEEYRQTCLTSYSVFDTDMVYLQWYKWNTQLQTITLHTICNIVQPRYYILGISNFVKGKYNCVPLPRLYHYSSGLNHPSAYK